MAADYLGGYSINKKKYVVCYNGVSEVTFSVFGL